MAVLDYQSGEDDRRERSLRRRLFGPSQEEVWGQLAAELGGAHSGSFWRGQKVEVRVESWVLTLDLLHIDTAVYTRMRAPYLNADGFRFTVHQKSIFSGLGKMLGMQDIEIGEAFFDSGSSSSPMMRPKCDGCCLTRTCGS